VSPTQPRVPEPEPTADPLAAADGPDALPAIRVASTPSLKTYPSFGSYSEPAPWFTFEFAKFLKGPWGIGAALVLLVGLALMPLGVRYYRSQPEPVPISLTMSDHDRRIQVRWDRSSRIIREAVRGSIEFVDGEQSRTAALSVVDLLHGNVTYMRQTGDVQIRLEVENDLLLILKSKREPFPPFFNWAELPRNTGTGHAFEHSVECRMVDRKLSVDP
jgi:hypothetical protein